MKKMFISFGCIFVILLLVACGSNTSSSNLPTINKEDILTSTTSAPKETTTQEQTTLETVTETTIENVTTNSTPATSNKSEYGIGETWIVEGLWSLTILGATETDERNQFSEKSPAAVYIVDYVYTNNGYEDGFMDGLYLNIEDMIVDSAGKMGYSYPLSVANYPQETPVGATCYAQACIGVDNPGTFSLTINEYDSNFKKLSAKFIVDPTLPYAEYTPQASTINNANAIKIGETWIVDGLWSLTITGVYATDERNQYSDKYPAAVYIVDYSYTNLGYEDDFMDGLYMTIEDMIVDAGGKMGYSYPLSVNNYPQETPVGATCDAQACIGVDTPGSFTITVSEYDNNYNKYTQSFLIEIN